MPAEAGTAFRNELRRVLPGRSESDQKFLLLGILTKHLEGIDRPVLVGGSLVELYTMGAVASADMDLVGDHRSVAKLLLAAGFQLRGRYFEGVEFPVLVEVPGHSLRPTESVEPILFEGYTLYAVSLEDSIVDRLLAAKFWRSTTDWERAVLLAATHAKAIKWPELMKRAAANDVADVAADLRTATRA